jgi:hypothetical protein
LLLKQHNRVLHTTHILQHQVVDTSCEIKRLIDVTKNLKHLVPGRLRQALIFSHAHFCTQLEQVCTRVN